MQGITRLLQLVMQLTAASHMLLQKLFMRLYQQEWQPQNALLRA
jgi:hypothetical protein